jgi:hypothetical protein
MSRPSLVLIASLSLTLGLTGTALAGKKNKKKKGQEPAAEQAPPKVKTELPKDGTSKSFAEKLMATPLTDFEPPDNDGTLFLYDTLTFKAGNVWEAAAWLDVPGDRFDCVESGSWTLDAAESELVAPVNWTVDETNCPGRKAGAATRAKLTIQPDGDVSVEFR